MSWTAISATTIESHAVAPLLELCKSSDADLVTDRFPVIRDSVVQQIRVAIASGEYELDSDETLIPPELVSCAAWLIIEQLVAVMPLGVIALTEDQRSLLRSERARLDRIADGKLLVTAPDSPEEAQTVQRGVGAVVEIGERTRRYTRDTLSGL
jgi:hypothetical protein